MKESRWVPWTCTQPDSLKRILSYSGPRDFILLIPKFFTLDLGGVAGEHQRTDPGLQAQKLFQRTFRWDLIGGISEVERIPAKLFGLQGQHSPSTRIIHPHGNKEMYQEASLMKQASCDTSSTKKNANTGWGQGQDAEKEWIKTAKAFRGRIRGAKIPLACKKCQGQWMLYCSMSQRRLTIVVWGRGFSGSRHG